MIDKKVVRVVAPQRLYDCSAMTLTESYMQGIGGEQRASVLLVSAFLPVSKHKACIDA